MIPDDASAAASQSPTASTTTPSSRTPSSTTSLGPQAVATIASAVRFCRTCGAAWQDDWLECLACAQRRQAVASPSAATFADERRSILSSVALYFSLLAVSFVSIIVVRFAGGEITFPGMAAIEFIMSAITIAWCIASWRTVVPTLSARCPLRWLALAPVLAIGTFAVAALAILGMQKILRIDQIDYMQTFAGMNHKLGWAILMICVQPAIIEELAFRGVIFTSLSRVLGGRDAIFVSALMFAILHLSIPSMPHLFLLGVVVAWLRYKSGSLLPGMLLHFTHNLLAILGENHRSIFHW